MHVQEFAQTSPQELAIVYFLEYDKIYQYCRAEFGVALNDDFDCLQFKIPQLYDKTRTILECKHRFILDLQQNFILQLPYKP